VTIGMDNGRTVFPKYTHVFYYYYLLFLLAIIATYDLPLYALMDGSPRRGPIL